MKIDTDFIFRIIIIFLISFVFFSLNSKITELEDTVCTQQRNIYCMLLIIEMHSNMLGFNDPVVVPDSVLFELML